MEIEHRLDAIHYTLYLAEDNDNPIGFIRVTDSEREPEFTGAVGEFFKFLVQTGKGKAPTIISG